MNPYRLLLRVPSVLLYGFLLGGLFYSGALAQNRIAFVTPTGQLATISPDGENERTLSAPGQLYQFPAWSPDNSRLAAIASSAVSGSVVVVDAVTEGAGGEAHAPQDAEPTVLYQSLRETPIYLYWAPGGEQLGFLANHPEGLALSVVEVQETTGGSANPVQVVTTGNPLYWQWGQNSARVFVHRTVLGDTGSGEVSFRSSEAADQGVQEQGVEEIARAGLFNVPSLSVGERFRAYTEQLGGAQRIVLEGHTPSTESVRREVPYEGVAAFSWSPVSEQLALMTPPAPSPHPYGPIRLLDAESGDLTTLFGGTALAFFWSPDGEHLAYLSTLAGDGGGQIADAGTAQPLKAQLVQTRPVQRGQNVPLLLELSVLEVATQTSRTLTTFAPTSLFFAQFLPFFDQYALSHNLWAPDSDALVLPMTGEGGRSQVVVVPLSGEPRAIAEGEMPFWSND